MRALSEYKRAGVIRAIGASNFGTDLILQANEVDTIDVLQSEFNVFNNTNAKQLFEHCKKSQTGFMAYGPLAKGILSGRVTKDRKYDASDFRAQVSFVQKQAESLFSLQHKFLNLAKVHGLEPQVLATAYVLSRAETSVTIAGMKSIAQVDSLLPAADVTLSPQIVAELNAMSEEATPLYLEAYNE
jgi:aryl-alcohol dehydrogenase-like predicted oxidoreductase